MAFDVRRLDIYRKIPKDLTQPTLTGAVISMSCLLFIAYLLLSELIGFLSVSIVSELFVDRPGKEGRISVKINVTFPRMRCDSLGLDIQDEMGRHEVGFVEDTVKLPVENGCRFEGKFHINKVPGNFHLSTHGAKAQPTSPNMRHVIHGLVFGEEVKAHSFPGSFNALRERDTRVGGNNLHSHDYILKVVPSIFENIRGKQWFSYQYTYAHKEYMAYHHTGQVNSAVWFKYDLNPITVKYTERRQPFYSFLTSVCAIVGGTFTVAGIIDSFVFTASEFYKKLEIGKLS